MVKRMFIALASIGLAVNLFSDFNIFRQSKISIDTGNWVYNTYEVSQAIDSTKISILESQLKKVPVAGLKEQIRNLGKLVQDVPSQKTRSELLMNLSAQDIVVPEHNQALEILSYMAAVESSLLAMRLNTDATTNSESVGKALFSNAVDIVLIFVFIGFYFYERRTALKLQNALSKTLIHVENTNQQLQLALASRDAQFKTVVHDLKNPLGSIKGFAELLYEEAADTNSVLAMANIIQRVSNSTLALVSSVLEKTNESAPKESVNTMECLTEVCTYLGPVANEKSQKIQIKNHFCNFNLWGHPQQLHDMFFNLIGNALKFSPRGSIVTVECTELDNFHEIRIKDQGPGFAKEDFPKLFIAQAKLSAKPTGDEISTGIGLYSVKQTIDSFNGAIEIKNNADRGACVMIRFPTVAENKSIDLQ